MENTIPDPKCPNSVTACPGWATSFKQWRPLSPRGRWFGGRPLWADTLCWQHPPIGQQEGVGPSVLGESPGPALPVLPSGPESLERSPWHFMLWCKGVGWCIGPQPFS